MGAEIALKMAIQYPARVHSAVLAGSGWSDDSVYESWGMLAESFERGEGLRGYFEWATPPGQSRTADEIEGFEDESFSRVVHDPPTFSLAGELYSGDFYRHLFRVLKRKGRVFHYIGDLESRAGRNVARGVVRRRQEAGFSRVVRKPEAFGVVAFK